MILTNYDIYLNVRRTSGNPLLIIEADSVREGAAIDLVEGDLLNLRIFLRELIAGDWVPVELPETKELVCAGRIVSATAPKVFQAQDFEEEGAGATLCYTAALDLGTEEMITAMTDVPMNESRRVRIDVEVQADENARRRTLQIDGRIFKQAYEGEAGPTSLPSQYYTKSAIDARFLTPSDIFDRRRTLVALGSAGHGSSRLHYVYQPDLETVSTRIWHDADADYWLVQTIGVGLIIHADYDDGQCLWASDYQGDDITQAEWQIGCEAPPEHPEHPGFRWAKAIRIVSAGESAVLGIYREVAPLADQTPAHVHRYEREDGAAIWYTTNDYWYMTGAYYESALSVTDDPLTTAWEVDEGALPLPLVLPVIGVLDEVVAVLSSVVKADLGNVSGTVVIDARQYEQVSMVVTDDIADFTLQNLDMRGVLLAVDNTAAKAILFPSAYGGTGLFPTSGKFIMYVHKAFGETLYSIGNEIEEAV